MQVSSWPVLFGTTGNTRTISVSIKKRRSFDYREKDLVKKVIGKKKKISIKIFLLVIKGRFLR